MKNALLRDHIVGPGQMHLFSYLSIHNELYTIHTSYVRALSLNEANYNSQHTQYTLTSTHLLSGAQHTAA